MGNRSTTDAQGVEPFRDIHVPTTANLFEALENILWFWPGIFVQLVQEDPDRVAFDLTRSVRLSGQYEGWVVLKAAAYLRPKAREHVQRVDARARLPGTPAVVFAALMPPLQLVAAPAGQAYDDPHMMAAGQAQEILQVVQVTRCDAPLPAPQRCAPCTMAATTSGCCANPR